MKRGADVLGTILNGHAKMAARMGHASRMPERAGPPSVLGVAVRPRPQDMMSRVAGASASCIACGNHDPSHFRIDYKNGDNICLRCGAVDPNRVLSTEEESRTFADDTAADKEKKKRSEKRNDGRLGSFIAVGQEKRGQLANASVQSLQRAHLRTQAPPEEILKDADKKVKVEKGEKAMEQGKKRPPVSEAAIDKTAGQRKQCIDHIGSKMELHEGLIELAKSLVDKLDECQREHVRYCAKEGCKLHRKRWSDEHVAAALIHQASSRGDDGGGSTRAIREIAPYLQKDDATAILNINREIGWRLDWRAHCSTAINVSGGAGGSAAGPPSNTLQGKQGYVARVIDVLVPQTGTAANRLSTMLKEHAFGVLQWMQDQSLLEGSKPAKLAGAALVLTYTELLRDDAPGIDGVEPLTADVLAKQLQVSAVTINNALKEIKPMRKKHLETLSIAAAGELSGSGN